MLAGATGAAPALTPSPTRPPDPLERAAFFWKFLRAPSVVGSLTPSSRFLADRIARHVPWTRVASVAELGAGTGVITRRIRDRCRSGCRVAVFEHDAPMRARLAQAFPEFTHHADAAHLATTLQRLDLPALDCVISGLPLAIFPRDTRARVLDQVVAALAPGGVFVAFQYSLQLRASLRGLFRHVEIELVPLNLPPAFVYVCWK
ncbi:Ribosomal RNA adenine dimethylase [Minicystis rosea]|nr:Ribosomal RNA adenine dimethylase [Minicystis rosea]